jgi:hypothetical protein
VLDAELLHFAERVAHPHIVGVSLFEEAELPVVVPAHEHVGMDPCARSDGAMRATTSVTIR